MIVSQSRTVCLLLHQLISSLILFLNPSTIETLNPDLSQCILFDMSIFLSPGNHLQHALAVCSDDLTLMVWDTSADVSNSSGNGSTPWYFILILSFDAWISSLGTCIMKSGSMICLGASRFCVCGFCTHVSEVLICRKHLTTISGYHDRTIFSVHWSR